MSMRSTILFAVFGVCLATGPLRGQAENDIGDFWFKIHLNKKINERWALGTDLQLRRQNDFVASEHNMFRFPSTYSARVWVYFKINPNWTIVTAPLAFFQNYQLTPLETLNEQRELRTMGGATYSFQKGRFTNRNRLLYEYRWLEFDRPDPRHQHRLRLQNLFLFRLGAQKPEHQLDLMFFNEFFYATPNYHRFDFDQNRDFLGLQWKCKSVTTILGYQYARQRQGAQRINRHSLLANLILNF